MGIAAAAHLAVRTIRWGTERYLMPSHLPRQAAKEAFARRYPKAATVTSLVVSALTFVIYFAAVGFVMREIGVDLTAYFATATVIGLAVGFGSQGLVQDVVIGLTLLFSDAFDIGDMIEVSGQVGRVQKVGLRFTTIVNFLGQTVYVPNRNIGQVGRYLGGCVRAWVDIQVPGAGAEGGDDNVTAIIRRLAEGMRSQHRSIIVEQPKVSPPREASAGGWRFVRVQFKLWPGQGALIEGAFRQRVVAAMKELDPSYADWMVVVTYRVLKE